MDLRYKFQTRLSIALIISIVFLIPAFSQAYVDWYPTNITAPGGTHYQCNLTALPRSLTGIPSTDRSFVNHTYSMILKAVQAKVLMLKALEDSQNISEAYSRYYYDIRAIRTKIMDESTPTSLGEFKRNTIKALDYQLNFFNQAYKMRLAGKSMTDIYGIPDGHTASNGLRAAWQNMCQLYPSWSPELKNSIYHHLCALDLF